MKKSANTLLFEKQLARIERILNKSEHSDLTIQKPTRITKSFLTRLEKIKPKNIESVIESGDFTFTSRPSKDFSRLVDQTKSTRIKASAKASAKALASAKASASASASAKASASTPTTTRTPHLSTSKAKPTSDLSSRYKALKKTQSTPQSPKRKGDEESKKASPSLFGGVRDDNFDSMFEDFSDDVSGEFQYEDLNGQEIESSVDQTGHRYVEYHGDYLDRETGEVIENIRSAMIENEEFSKLDVARERWEEYSADAREGSQVTDVINRYISGYGADVVFANMSNFGSEFWEALDVCHRYETQGMWGGEDDEGAAWVGAGEYAENIDFIINYMFEKFDPWFGPEQMD